ncbi:papain family cysteine protease, partial [Necator americanus]
MIRKSCVGFSTLKIYGRHLHSLTMLLILALIVTSSAKLDLSDELPIEEAEKLSGKDLVEYLRRHQTLFQVKDSEDEDHEVMDEEYLKIPDGMYRKAIKLDENEEIPDRFDARDKWPQCAHLIGDIRDQTKCGSCWAVSAAEVMTDRACVQSGGRIKVHLSDTEILSCCGKFCGYGCRGGYAMRAWKYIMRNGICTGGHYGSKGVCKPYAFHPCGVHKDQKFYGPCPKTSYETPQCRHSCQRGYVKQYQKDKVYAKDAYMLPNDEKLIRKEIMTNGPVQGSYETYKDFKLYDGGIYE